jgi:hypothetical protein
MTSTTRRTCITRCVPRSLTQDSSRRIRARSFAPRACLVVLPVALAVFGCVSGELRSVETAREAYEDCVLEFSESDPDCKALRISLLETQRRYQENSRRAWGCNPKEEECPVPRQRPFEMDRKDELASLPDSHFLWNHQPSIEVQHGSDINRVRLPGQRQKDSFPIAGTLRP